ncbi:hypothetical protein GOP47_0011001 [Adiantum capillus-veneris]|uniref:Uncharacterized protein n=1 Tax=Adiantum capillus-veneris TaxID=13818 RepID=A0A9D4ZJC7_ADICA|nr:hypothetical protein GOP47_0011001 [Adiantum capillus-veneris]
MILMLRTPKGLKSILLTITINDLGNFGCYDDCTTNATVPLQALRHTYLVFEFVPPDIRAKVAASATCSLIFLVYTTVLLIRYRRSLAYRFDDGALSEEDMLTKTRVFNPAWSMDAKRESTFDFGISKFAVSNEESLIGNAFEAPLAYKDIGHDGESDSLLVKEGNEPPVTDTNMKSGIRRNRFILDD